MRASRCRIEKPKWNREAIIRRNDEVCPYDSVCRTAPHCLIPKPVQCHVAAPF